MKINYSSVRNRTTPPVAQVGNKKFPQPQAQEPAQKPASIPSSTKQATEHDSLENQVFNAKTTTTKPLPSLAVGSSPSSFPDLPDPTPNPDLVLHNFHQRLCDAFGKAGKGLPTRKQSAAAYAMIPDDWEGFLDWLPSSEAFKTTRGAGGLPSLIDFYDADKERPASPPPTPSRGDVPIWKRPEPTKCLECADTGWRQITKGDKTGVERCSCGARVHGQYETLGGVA